VQAIKEIGYLASDAWFVPLHSIPSHHGNRTGVIYEGGTEVYRGTAEAVNAIRHFDPSIWSMFTTADSVPRGTPVPCAVAPVQGAGTYDCASGTWTSDTAPCCPRGDSPDQDSCADDARPPCVALVAESPDISRGANEETIASTAGARAH